MKGYEKDALFRVSSCTLVDRDQDSTGALVFLKEQRAFYTTTPGVPIVSTMAYIGSSLALEAGTAPGTALFRLMAQKAHVSSALSIS